MTRIGITLAWLLMGASAFPQTTIADRTEGLERVEGSSRFTGMRPTIVFSSKFLNFQRRFSTMFRPLTVWARSSSVSTAVSLARW